MFLSLWIVLQPKIFRRLFYNQSQFSLKSSMYEIDPKMLRNCAVCVHRLKADELCEKQMDWTWLQQKMYMRVSIWLNLSNCCVCGTFTIRMVIVLKHNWCLCVLSFDTLPIAWPTIVLLHWVFHGCAGSRTVRWENKTMYCITTVFGLAI